MKITLHEVAKASGGKYAEVIKSNKFIQVENMSLDFMIQTNSTWEQFRKGIILFRSTLMESKWADFKNFKIYINEVMRNGAKARFVTFEKFSKKQTAQSAIFAENERLNAWMVDEIIRQINNNVAVEIYPGLVLMKKHNSVIAICSKEFMEA